MNAVVIRLHVLAIALWFGTVVFFTFAGVLIFGAFGDVSRLPAGERPLWLPLPEAFDRDDLGLGDRFPSPLRLEQGSRAAGVAVGSVFPTYYLLQTAAGAVVFTTMLLLRRQGYGGPSRLLPSLAALALLSVLVGWAIERHVADLRVPRNELTDAVLRDAHPAPARVAAAREARAAFGRWHGISLVQNFVTLGLVTVLTLGLPGTLAPRRTS